MLKRVHSSEGVNGSLFVSCLDSFKHNGSDCLVLEMLTLTLREAVDLRQGRVLLLSDIRPIAKQVHHPRVVAVTTREYCWPPDVIVNKGIKKLIPKVSVWGKNIKI